MDTEAPTTTAVLNEEEQVAQPVEDTADRDAEEVYEPSFFEEEETCRALLQQVATRLPTDNTILLPSPGTDPNGVSALLQVKFPAILDRYQESPHLLHPHLEKLIQPLVDMLLTLLPSASVALQEETAILQGKGQDSDGSSGQENKQQPQETVVLQEHALGQNFDMFDTDAPRHPLHLVCGALYTVAKTAGEENCISYFPHEAKHYEDVFYTLRLWKTNPVRRREWEVRYCLLLWLSNLILVPFELSIIDSSCGAVTDGSSHTNSTGTGALSLSDAVLLTAVSFLPDSTKCREGAALLIARLATRPDSGRHRDLFFSYARQVLSGVPVGERSAGLLSRLQEPEGSRTFFVQGLLLAIATTMKLGLRQELVQYASPLIPCVLELASHHTGDGLISKTAVSVVQRLALSMLKKKTASWKYRRHVESLAANLGGAEEGKSKAEEAEDDTAIEGDIGCLEDAIAFLMEMISHKDTIVRWCAAEGIGRVCERLPEEMVVEIVDSLQDSFATEYNDQSWHGGLLTYAELCRRGVVSASYLGKLVPRIAKGLAFDWSKGTYSVGAHVRDAASYTCWSIARAYDAEDIKPHVYDLSVSLVVTSLFDREVNVRRAAAAAFQECVGRLGNFPYGIDLVTTMDFFSLASIKNAFTVVAPKVALFETYRPRMLEELVCTKLSHWDRAVRQCASVALGLIGPLDASMMHEEVVPELLTRVTDTTVAARHGALLGLAELVRHLPVEGWSEAEQVQVAEVVVRLDSARLFRSRGGEYIREACCHLLAACAAVHFPLPDCVPITKISGEKGKARTLKKVQDFFDDTQKNILEWVQLCAADSFRQFAEVYYKEFNPAFHGKVLEKMRDGCAATKPTLERRGVLAAYGGIPASWLVQPEDEGDDNTGAPYFLSIFRLLEACAVLEVDQDPELADAEGRRNAVTAMGYLLPRLPAQHAAITEEWFSGVLHTFLRALDDYATDKRGDVGSFVRLAALRALPTLLVQGVAVWHVCAPGQLVQALQATVRLAMERLDRVREAAVRALRQLLLDRQDLACVLDDDAHAAGKAETQYLADLLQKLALVDCGSPQQVLPVVVPALLRNCPTTYAYAAVEGLVLSAGDLSRHVRDPAVEALLTAFCAAPPAGETVPQYQGRLSRYLTQVATSYPHCERVLVPLSRTLDYVLGKEVLSAAAQQEAVQVLRGEMRHFATTITVLLPLCTLLTTLCRCSDLEARRTAWSLALVMIASRYPKVRAKVATDFYTALLVVTSDATTAPQQYSAAMAHLSATQWDSSDAAKVRSARNALYGMLDLQPPAGKEGGEEDTKRGAGVRTEKVAANYMDLVRETGY